METKKAFLPFIREVHKSIYARSEKKFIGQKLAETDPDMKFDGSNHLISQPGSSYEFRHCKKHGLIKMTQFKCIGCSVGTHPQCMLPYHTKNLENSMNILKFL